MDDVSTVTQLDLVSYIIGDLKNNSYYSTWFQFEDLENAGKYETVTCTAQF